MKPLATQFRKNGFDFTMLKREGNVALFQKSKPHFTEPHFEIILVQSHNGYELAGRKIEAAETFPSSETWGTKGWTCSDEQRARELFLEKCVA